MSPATIAVLLPNNRPTVANAQPGAQIRFVSLFGTLDPTTTVTTGSIFQDNQVLIENSAPCFASVSIDSISQDTGDPTDFVTFDRELVIEGSVLGTDLTVDVDGASYTSNSPELTISKTRWTLDLTATSFTPGSYLVTATGVVDGQSATDTKTIVVESEVGEWLVNNPVLSAIPANVTFDAADNATVVLDVEARKTVSSNVFYVDAAVAAANPTGSPASPFNDLPGAFDHITTNGLSDAVINVAAGSYTWGDAINPDFEPEAGPKFKASLTVIGAGSELTKIYQGANDKAAGLFSEGGESLYVEGMAFIGLGQGGINNFNEHAFEATGGVNLTFVDTLFTEAPDGDGLFVGEFDNVVVKDSVAIRNSADGFSYTATPGPSPMYVIEIDVVAAGNGTNGEASSQGSTAHRNSEIVRVNSLYANNPTNIEDTGLTSWNIGITAQNPTAFRASEGDYVNFLVRGDKNDVTDGTAWFVSGNTLSEGGIVHARRTTANDAASTEIFGNIEYTSKFDLASHPIGVVMTYELASQIATGS